MHNHVVKHVRDEQKKLKSFEEAGKDGWALLQADIQCCQHQRKTIPIIQCCQHQRKTIPIIWQSYAGCALLYM